MIINITYHELVNTWNWSAHLKPPQNELLLLACVQPESRTILEIGTGKISGSLLNKKVHWEERTTLKPGDWYVNYWKYLDKKETVIKLTL